MTKGRRIYRQYARRILDYITRDAHIVRIGKTKPVRRCTEQRKLNEDASSLKAGNDGSIWKLRGTG